MYTTHCVLSSSSYISHNMSNQETEKHGHSSADNNHHCPCVPADRPPLSQVTDRFGNTIHFGDAGDYWHPPFPIGANTDYRTHVRNIEDMEIRPDDLLICSYPKTGLHWTSEIISMLKRKNTEHISDGLLRDGFIDMKPISSVDNVASPRILITHVPFRHLPKQLFQKKIKFLLLDRNPKDVLVSYYNHWHMRKPPMGYAGTFEQFFQVYFEIGFLYGNYLDYTMEFQNGIEAHPELDVFISVFEDMKLDPIGGVKKLNEYLQTECSDALCEEIAIACSFQNLKEFKDQHTPESFKASLHAKSDSIYRKGEVGDWKNWFTVAMNEKFDKEYSTRMKSYKTEYKYTLP
uniref:Sulfotransferase domain-containing protein n=1 Tax=Arion vulgaris TaxID=1028688 RepID=A0A0B6Z6Q1_9EUPU